MKKILSLLISCFLISCVVPDMVLDASAFLMFKGDATKSSSKFSVWIQTQKSKCEKILEGVQTSQFGQFVGDAIKYTKEGIKFAKDVYNRSTELYGEIKEEVLDSPEYKTAMISKEIASESLKLKELQEEKLKKQEEIQSEMDLLKEQTAAKISNIQQNLVTMEQSYSPVSEEDDEFTPTPEMAGIEVEIEQLQSQLDMYLADYERDIDNIEDEYKEKIITQGEKVADLTKELSEVASSSGLFKKKETKDSEEALEETQKTFLFLGAPSIREENKIKKQRKEALSEIIVETMKAKADKQLTRASTEDKTNTKADLSATMPGESEGSGINTEVLSEQLKILRSYIDVVLADLKLQASIEVNSLRRVTSVPLKKKFNLCDYTDQSNVGLEGLKKKASKALQVVDKIQDTASQVKENINKAQEAANKVQNTVNQVKDTVNQAQEAIDNAKDKYQQLEGMTEDIQGAVSQYGGVDASTIGVF